MRMTFSIHTRQLAYIWKQSLVLLLILIALGSLMMYLYLQKRYARALEQDYAEHWEVVRAFQQRITEQIDSAEAFMRMTTTHDAVLQQMSSALFQDYPTLFRISILNMNDTILFGQEAHHIAQSLHHKSPASSSRTLTPVQQPQLPRQSHVIQFPLVIERQRRGFLRAEFLVNEALHGYLRMARMMLYSAILVSAAMILLGIMTLFTRVIRHLSAKQEQLEEYAISLEESNRHLRRAKQDLYVSEKLASLGYLAAGIAHEIGNPLGAVLGYIELLEKKSISPEKKDDIVRRMKDDIERIRRIIQELVHFSRPRSLKIHTIDINVLLKKVVSQLPPIQDRDIQFSLQLTEFPLFAEVDDYKLQSVFVNILQNSIDAIETQGEIRLSTSRRIRESTTMIEGSEVIAIQIRDTGSGMSEDLVAKMFDPFFTTKDPGSGMGLGLSLCHRIIESLHGEIEVQSTPGAGTDVFIFLPPARKDTDAHSQQTGTRT